MCDRFRRHRGNGSKSSWFAVRFLILVALLPVPVVGFFATPAAYGADPSIGVMVSHDWIQISDFPPDTGVTVSVNDGAKGSETVTTDAAGFFHLNWWEKGNENRPVPGDKVTAEYGLAPVVRVEMHVQALQATADLAADSVAGTALAPGGAPLAGKTVQITVNSSDWQTWLASSTATTGSDGAFTLDLLPFNVVPGQRLFLTYWDAPDGSQSGNRTMIEVYNGIPSLKVMVDRNWITLFDFPPDTGVTVSVNGGAKGSEVVTADANGYAEIAWWVKPAENRPLAGDTVTATYDGGTIAMQVRSVAATADLALNRITGTAFSAAGGPLAGAQVVAWVYTAGDWSQELATAGATVGTDGSFVIDLSPYDLERGPEIDLMLLDLPDGSGARHQTHREVYNAIPALGAGVDNNWISGEGFPAGAGITLSVNGGTKGSESVTADSGGRFWVNWWSHGEDGRPLPGDTVTAAYGDQTATMVVQDLQGTRDLVADRITGTAFTPAGSPLAGRKVMVQIYPPGQDWSVELASAEATVGVDGGFKIDLFPFDLVQGQNISLTLWDAPDGSLSGNQTARQIPNAIPAVSVMLDHNWISGEGFPPSSSVTVTVNGGAKGTETLTADSTGQFWVGWQSHGDGNRPLPGDTVAVVSGDVTVEVVLPTIVATADPEKDLVTGTAFDAGGIALTGRRVQVRACPPGDWSVDLASADTTVDDAGNFTLDLSPFDLVRGQGIWLTLWDAPDGSTSGNQTIRTVYNGIPKLGAQIDHGWISGQDFPARAGLTLTVNAGAKGTAAVTTDGNGSFHQDWNPQDESKRLLPGDTVTATIGGIPVEMLIQNIQATVNIGTNIVAGTAFDALASTALAGEKVSVQVSQAWNQQNPWKTLEALVGAGGSFSLDFTGTWDIQRGNAITVTYTSPAGHRTMRVPALIDIVGKVTAKDSGLGLPGVKVSASRALMDTAAEVFTDGNGDYSFKNLPVGAYKLHYDATDYNAAHGTNYMSEWHHDKPSFETADWIVLSPIAAVQTVDAELEDAGGGIAGQVTGDGGLGLPDILVCVQSAAWTDPSPNCAALVGTDANGDYAVSGIIPGDYRVLFYPGNHNEAYGKNYGLKWYADTVTVAQGEVTQPVSAQLEQGGKIAGKITGAGDQPLPNVQVRVLDENGNWEGDAETDAAGEYTASGVPPGNHKVHFSADDYNRDHDSDYVAVWYRLAGSPTPRLVAVETGVTTPDVGAQLAIGGRISGQVVGTAKAPLRAVQVTVFAAADAGANVGAVTTNPGGLYVVRGLAPGNYKVSFDPLIYNIAAGTDYAAEWYDNQAAFATATSIAVAAGANVVVNAQLNRAANSPPALTVVCDRSSLEEGQTVVCTLTATDPDDNLLTFSSDNRPRGSTLNAVTGAFTWTPAYDQSGVYDIHFAVADNGSGPLSDTETVRITVTDHNPQLFFDDFKDGNAAGDKHWTKNSGTWLVDGRKTYQATSLLKPNLSTVKPASLAPLTAGRIEAQTMMKALKPLDANALVLFAFQSTAKYRYVQLVRGELRVGQVGTFGGVATKIVARKVMPLLPGVNYQVKVDAHPDGRVWVSINNVVKIKCKFPAAAAGGVGLGALKNGAQFDNVRVSDRTVLP